MTFLFPLPVALRKGSERFGNVQRLAAEFQTVVELRGLLFVQRGIGRGKGLARPFLGEHHGRFAGPVLQRKGVQGIGFGQGGVVSLRTLQGCGKSCAHLFGRTAREGDGHDVRRRSA